MNLNPAWVAFYSRAAFTAAAFVGLISFGIFRTTGRTDLVRQYCAAHLIALGLGAVVDVLLCLYVIPQGSMTPAALSLVLMTPIAFFIGFSIYLCHRDTPVHLPDVLIPMSPIVLWALLVMYGWQHEVGDYHVIGAWFVSAGCGGVDLASKYGPASLTRRPLVSRAAGYLLMLAGVYLLLPKAIG